MQILVPTVLCFSTYQCLVKKMAYKDTAYDYFVSEGWTYQQVYDATYQQVATACGVTIEPNGNSPADFFFHKIRRRAGNRLEKEQSAVTNEQRRLNIRNKVRELPAFPNATVKRIDRGDTAYGPGWFVRRGS